MHTRKGLPKGVGVRHSGKYYFEVRIPDSKKKLYCNKIKSREEGALCYDFFQRYSELWVIGGKRQADVTLNYPEYSRSWQLEPLRSDFDIQHHKEDLMESILRQVQAAAKNLPEGQGRPAPIVGSPSQSNPSSSHQNVHGKPQVAKQDLPGVCTNQPNLQKIYDFFHHLITSKVIENGKLKRQIADINEDSGYIFTPESCPDDFADSMARLKQLVESAESLTSECLELRKLIADHNLKVIDEWLMDNDNDSSGRQRANEDERLPRLPEGCPSEDRCDPETPISQWSSNDWFDNLY